ncbi:MAG: hypothetical protein JO001_15945 [Alphaproteobacteria bacterium]|nr:hypothetical protein [Alphaproteobacteria bacterium]
MRSVGGSHSGTLEILTLSLGSDYVRRAPDGHWLGRATFLGGTFRFFDAVGRTVWIARLELSPAAGSAALATVRDMHGQTVGIIAVP